MQMFVVNITRQFGSLGRAVAKELSEILEVEYYDRDIVEEAAKKLDLPVSFISKEEENTKNSLRKMKYPLGKGTSEIQDKIFVTQKYFIEEKAEKESAIFVGRCSDYILRKHKNKINVFIYASYDQKLKNCVDQLNMDLFEAEKMIKDVDHARDAYRKKYAGYYAGSTDHTDIMINSEIFGVRGTAEILADIIRKKFDEQ